MTNVILTHSQRIGAKTAPITFSEDRRACFVWTKAGRVVEKNGSELVYLNCSGCRSAKQVTKDKRKVSSVKLNLTIMEWIDDPADYDHRCVPKNANTVAGVNARRSMQAELASGSKETAASARVRTDARIVHEFSELPEADFQEIRNAGLGSVLATEGAFNRAKRKKYPNVSTFQEFLAAENRAMRLTLQGSDAKFGQAHFGETLLLHGDEDMLIFSSNSQLKLLMNCAHLICDGTFKYAPKGTNQIYRIFGLIRQTHATPLVTVLLKGKSKLIYERMWKKVREALLNLGIVNLIRYANFDAETAAFSSFKETFLGVDVKICSFHVKQGLYRKVQALGLATEYRNSEPLERIVRMIGALQITPMVEWDACLQLIRDKIRDTNFDLDVENKMDCLLQYFENTWLTLSEVFCLFGYAGPRTTNHAESYHSKQRLHFSMKSKLGRWIVAFRQLTNTEELDSMNVFEGRQPPRRQGIDYSEIGGRILELKENLLLFLSTDEGISREGRYIRKMDRYLSRIGRFMGINFAEYREVIYEDNEEEDPAVVVLPEENYLEDPANIVLHS